MNVAVLGAGAFGTALAFGLRENGHEVFVWSRSGQSRLKDLDGLPPARQLAFRELRFTGALVSVLSEAAVLVV